MTVPILLWFRNDLRMADSPALGAATRDGAPVVPVYILDDETPDPWRMGGASRWWLHGSLASLDEDLRRRGSRLLLRRGAVDRVIPALASETGARAVFWNRDYEGVRQDSDRRIETALRVQGIAVESFAGNVLVEPGGIATRGGGPFKVFTPFWKSLRSELRPGPPIRTPRHISAPQSWPAGDRLASWKLRPKQPDWAAGFGAWTPGETGAGERLSMFLRRGLQEYSTERNRPDLRQTSRLSPHLHFGEISAVEVWRRVSEAVVRDQAGERDVEAFLRELGWREFCRHLLFHFPELPEKPWRAGFARFPWRSDPASLKAWQRGLTGYPIVDAGMRELWTTGWMHNRVRMITASFLTKHLLIPWQEGEAWFWDTLVDADLASNAANWQWVAGSGADAAPYFRIFNPVLQGERFDPQGDYVRRWVPELSKLPAPDIHRPWTSERLHAAGVILGKTYPKPIVDHAAARARALKAFRQISG
ncbi:MAG TPA: deoxyribodipyrimidine photo-lyase [Alphaproteobacteria bacterium]|nr:deoxyribodipyrimidine photo-lyase [Alphaproteobacteria bacterium]